MAEDVEMCRRIGQHGEAFIADGAGILTHCNAGALATVLPEADDLVADQVRRIVLCSGKVYFDLLSARREREIEDIHGLNVILCENPLFHEEQYQISQ